MCRREFNHFLAQNGRFFITWVRNELSQSRAMMSNDFKVISHFLLSKTHLITGSSDITSSENLVERTAVFAEKTPYISTKYNPSGTLSNSGWFFQSFSQEKRI